MAFYRSERTDEDLLPKIRNLGINEHKFKSNLTYLEGLNADSSFNSVTELWRDRPSSAKRASHTHKKKSPRTSKKQQKAWTTSSTSSDSRASSPVPLWHSREIHSDPAPYAERHEVPGRDLYGKLNTYISSTFVPPQQERMANMSYNKTMEVTDHRLAGHGEIEEFAKDRMIKLTQERDNLSMQLSHFRNAAEVAQSDLAAERVKTKTLQEEIRRGQEKVSELEQKIIDLKCEIESSRQSHARQDALVQSLQLRVRDAEDMAKDRDDAIIRTDTTINSLRKELQTQQDKRQELESSLKLHLGIEEENAKKSDLWEKKYRELCATVGTSLQVEASPMSDIGAVIINRINDVVREEDVLKQRVNSLVHNMQNNDIEAKAGRETIMRLVADLGNEQKTSGERLSQIEALTRERDAALQKCREMEIEAQNVTDKLTHSQEAWNSTRKELISKEERLMEYEKHAHEFGQSQAHAESRFRHFRAKIAELLSVPDFVVHESEEAILKRLKGIRRSLFDLSSAEGKLHAHVKQLNEELESHKSLQQSSLQRANNAEAQLDSLTGRVKELEGQLIAADIEGQKLREDRRKYTAFLERLTRAMKLNEIALEVGLDLNADAILVRAEQLSKSETDTVQDRTSQVYSLQRKIKSLKQQVDSKDLQVSVTKKKISELEEILKDKSRLENEKEDTTLKNQKLKRHCERLQDEVQQLKTIVTELKAKLMETSELKVTTMEQREMIGDLEAVINKLAKSKHKTVKQLAEIKQELDLTAKGTKVNINKRPEYYEELENDLKSTKEALEVSRQREKQLTEFRAVLAKLIGLDIDTLTVPDYEIISRLERIVHAHNDYTMSTRNVEKMYGHHGISDNYSSTLPASKQARLYRPFTGTV